MVSTRATSLEFIVIVPIPYINRCLQCFRQHAGVKLWNAKITSQSKSSPNTEYPFPYCLSLCSEDRDIRRERVREVERSHCAVVYKIPFGQTFERNAPGELSEARSLDPLNYAMCFGAPDNIRVATKFDRENRRASCQLR